VVVDFHSFKDALNGVAMEKVMNEHATQVDESRPSRDARLAEGSA
jgi:hypothetical protein